MRAILIAVLLILTVISIYNGTISGPGGTKEAVRDRGGSVNLTIRSIDP